MIVKLYFLPGQSETLESNEPTNADLWTPDYKRCSAEIFQ